jgi:hypothetical protein
MAAPAQLAPRLLGRFTSWPASASRCSFPIGRHLVCRLALLLAHVDDLHSHSLGGEPARDIGTRRNVSQLGERNAARQVCARRIPAVC